MKAIVPNSVLPKGAKKIVTLKREVGGWAEMEFDAICERHGLKWLRVKNGMGGRADSEDWVCDLPSACLSVHDYQWREPRWGFDKFDSFDEAVLAEMRSGAKQAKHSASELREKANRADETVRLLTAALSSLQSPPAP